MSDLIDIIDRRKDPNFNKEKCDKNYDKEIIVHDLEKFVHKLLFEISCNGDVRLVADNSFRDEIKDTPSLLLELFKKNNFEESIKKAVDEAFYNILMDDLDEFDEAQDIECSDDEDNLDGLELNSFDKFINFIGLRGCKNLNYDKIKILRDEYINIVFY